MKAFFVSGDKKMSSENLNLAFDAINSVFIGVVALMTLPTAIAAWRGEVGTKEVKSSFLAVMLTWAIWYCFYWAYLGNWVSFAGNLLLLGVYGVWVAGWLKEESNYASSKDFDSIALPNPNTVLLNSLKEVTLYTAEELSELITSNAKVVTLVNADDCNFVMYVNGEANFGGPILRYLPTIESLLTTVNERLDGDAFILRVAEEKMYSGYEARRSSFPQYLEALDIEYVSQ